MKEKMLEQRGILKGALVKQLKARVPKGGIPAWRQIQAKDKVGYMDILTLVQEYGREEVERLASDIEKMRADGRRKQ